MLTTINHSIVFPSEMPEQAVKYFSQLLAFDIDVLLLNKQMKQLDEEYLLDENMIDKKGKILVKEKANLIDEFSKIKRKKDKINSAISTFLANSLKIYKPECNRFGGVEFIEKILLAYDCYADQKMDTSDLFDEEKDESSQLTPEQKDFLKFARSRDEANVHYMNKLENNKKVDEFNVKLEDYNKRLDIFNKKTLEPYKKAVKEYDLLEEKKKFITVQKEQLLKEILKMMEDDSNLQKQFEQLVNLESSTMASE